MVTGSLELRTGNNLHIVHKKDCNVQNQALKEQGKKEEKKN